MAEPAETEPEYDVVCPHCKKPFHSELIHGAASRYEGFKCPRGKLFVPYRRADEQDLVKPSD